MKNATYKIIVVSNGKHESFELESKKAKDKWLYKYLTCQERMWAWEQWQNSNYPTFDKWFKEFVKFKWKETDLQSLYVNKKIIIIKKINKGR